MLSDQEITDAAVRLSTGRLVAKDVDDLVSAFRLLLGPLEVTNGYHLKTDLEALDDADGRLKAAKMAACVVRLKNEDFGVATLSGELLNSDEEQRRLFTVYAFSLLYVVPAELAYLNSQAQAFLMSRKFSTSVPVTFVP